MTRLRVNDVIVVLFGPQVKIFSCIVVLRGPQYILTASEEESHENRDA
jgi:hypothetical protein